MTVFEQARRCPKCQRNYAKGEYGNHVNCKSCIEKGREYAKDLARRKKIRQEHLEAERVRVAAARAERERLLAEAFELYPEIEVAEHFERWSWWYNDEVEKTGKFLDVLFEDPNSRDFNVPLWHELLTLWHSKGKPSAPEGWEPEK